MFKIHKQAKYRSKPRIVDGIRFDSAMEANRYLVLKQMQRDGLIAGLTLQVPFVLAPKTKIDGEKRARPAVKYYLDFLYTTNDGKLVYEDAKGMQTPVYRLKKHLMKTVHNIDIIER